MTNTRLDIRETLEKQLQLLAERSHSCEDKDLPLLTDAILSVVGYLSEPQPQWDGGRKRGAYMAVSLKIIGDSQGVKVIIDGQEMTDVIEYTLREEPGKLPQVTLQIAITGLLEVQF